MNRINQYKTYQVNTVTPEEQIVLLYEGAQRFIDRAAKALEEQDYAAVSLNVGKAQQIFAELAASLNFDAGEIAHNLNRLYDYWSWRLSEGLIHKNAEAFREVSAVVGDMASAWAEASKQLRAQRGVRVGG